MRIASDGFGREAIELRTEAASPAPLIEITEGAEVGPAVLAPRQKVSVCSVRRRPAFLVFGGERRHRNAPREPRALLRVGIDREPRHCRSHRHSFKIVSMKLSLSSRFVFYFTCGRFLGKQTEKEGNEQVVQIRRSSEDGA